MFVKMPNEMFLLNVQVKYMKEIKNNFRFFNPLFFILTANKQSQSDGQSIKNDSCDHNQTS